jgi:hypothetical protein
LDKVSKSDISVHDRNDSVNLSWHFTMTDKCAVNFTYNGPPNKKAIKDFQLSGCIRGKLISFYVCPFIFFNFVYSSDGSINQIDIHVIGANPVMIHKEHYFFYV